MPIGPPKIMPKIQIEFSNPDDIHDTAKLTWRLLDHPAAYRWLERLATAKHRGFQIDDPSRFYGFNSIEKETEIALSRIKEDIDAINSHQPLIDRELLGIDDQDTLNYLHHVFEVYHGLLDQQDNDFWKTAPDSVHKALARLNIDVHRCEQISRGSKPRFVMTYYGLPKDTLLRPEDHRYITNKIEFGTMYICYAEIGKTLENLYHDQDEYIDPSAFIPYTHVSADFNVEFYDVTKQEAENEKLAMWKWFLDNRGKFHGLDCKFGDTKHNPGQIPVARLESSGDVIKLLESRQCVKNVVIL